MASPIGPADFVVGHAIVYRLTATVQGVITMSVGSRMLDLSNDGSV